MRVTVPLFVVLALGLSLHAGDSPADRHAKAIAPFVDTQSYVVAHIDVSKIDIDMIAKHLKFLDEAAPDKGKELEKVKALATLAKATFLSSGGKDIYAILNWASSLEDILLVAPLNKDAAPQALAALIGQIPGYQADVQGQVLLAGTKKALTNLKLFKAQAVPEMAKAFAALGDGSVQLILVPPFALKAAFIENFPVLPKEIGGGNSAVLDFQWAALQLDLKDKLAAKIVLQAPNAKAAEEIAKIARRGMDVARADKEVKRTFPDIDKLIAVFTPKVEGDRLTLTLGDYELTTVLLPLVQKQRDAASRMQSMNNLKQIALAMHNYHDTYKTFPAAASYDANGKPLLSWRVHILPFVEQDALYRQFRLNEPWDSEHNKKLIAQMPAVYRSPNQLNGNEGKTTYLVPVGPKTIFEGKKGIGFNKITDGTSNTIMIVESADNRAVFWTQPEDYKINDKNPVAGLVRPEAKQFNTAFADGSVRALSATIDPAKLRALFTASGGEVVDVD
jgi:Protein of unknown function (DUF1559)